MFLRMFMSETRKYDLWSIEKKRAPEEKRTVDIAVYVREGAMKVMDIEDALELPTYLFPDGVPPKCVEIKPMASRKGRIKIPKDKLELIGYFE